MDQYMNMMRKADQEGHTYACYCYHCAKPAQKKPFQRCATNLSLKIKDLSDYDMFIMHENQKKEMILKVNAVWPNYKELYIRPESYNDRCINSARKNLIAKNEMLKNQTGRIANNLPRKYGSTNKRLEIASTDPSVVSISNEIKFIENEIRRFILNQEDEQNDWEQSQKYKLAIELDMFDV